MTENATGYGVKVSIECFSPDGTRWSETETQWFGVSNEHVMNMLANGCAKALVEFSETINEVKYGDTKTPGKSR